MIITILSDSPMICTGYSDQAKKLANYLTKKGHEVHYLANAYTGQPIKNVELFDGTKFNFKIYGPKIFGDQYFRYQISNHLKETKSDILLILLDTFMLHGNPKDPNGWFLPIDTSPAKTIFWYPSDGGGGLPKHCEKILMKCDKGVAMSKFAQKQVKDYYNLDTDYIPLGTEPNRFYKLPEDQIKELINNFEVVNCSGAKIRGFLKDKFVIGSVFRNQPRKNPDKYIKTFSILKDKIPNAVLLMHTDPDDPAAPIDLRAQAKKYNVENRVVFTGMTAFKGFDWSQMNEVYNLMDVFYLPTSGEGFGIPIIEAMACKVPVVATDYTTTEELITQNNSGLSAKLVGTINHQFFPIKSQKHDLLMNNGTVLGGGWEVERGFIDIEDASKCIIELYNNPELRESLGENGRNAVLQKYDFDKNVAEEFIKLFETLK